MPTNEQTQLSDSARRELTGERDRLRSARDHYESERKKAEGLLIHIEAILAAANGTVPPTPARPLGQSGGLREAVTNAMAQHPEGVKPSDVTRTLEQTGYVHTGATSLALSVSNTMWRLAKTGAAKRSKNGKYRLVEQQESGGHG